MNAVLTVKLKDCSEFLAGDHTVLRELLHPSKALVSIGFSLAHGRLPLGQRSKRHRLTSSEVYYFVRGEGLFTVNEETVTVVQGSVVYVPPDAIQCVENTGRTELEFLCVVDPSWKAADEVVLE